MKTAIKLVLVYFLMQILGMLLVMPFVLVKEYCENGLANELQPEMGHTMLSVSMLLGFLLMGAYLWKAGYLTGDRRLYAPTSAGCLSWTLAATLSSILLVDFLMSHLAFLPNWMDQTFQVLQSGWLGILCVAVLGPVLEELLFRGAITRVLLKRYPPRWAILASGLIFGIFHVNPVQVMGACLLGILLAWLFYKTGSLVPGIVLHIVNNSLSVYLSLNYPDVDYLSQLMGGAVYALCLIGAVGLLIISCRALNRFTIDN